MKALDIKENGWLTKLAKLGGMRDDFEVKDRGIVKDNKIVDNLYEEGHISYQEAYARKKDIWRQINFCEYVRYVIRGVLVGLAAITCCLVVGTFTICASYALIAWVFSDHTLFKIPFWQAMLALGVIAYSVAGIAALWYFGKKRFDAWRNKRNSEQSALEKLDSFKVNRALELEMKLERRQVRAAFWGAIRNKTCFKVNFK